MRKISTLGVVSALIAGLAGGMNYILHKSKSQLIPTDKPMPEVAHKNGCKPKRKPRQHNKKKRGY